MKKTIVFTLLIITTAVFSSKVYAAQAPLMSEQDQLSYVEGAAKSIRRHLWTSGYENVETYVEKASKKLLDQHISESDDHESPLFKNEVSQLYKCHYSKTCELYRISSSSSIYGGYGSEAYFILLYTRSQKHFQIRHTVYSE